MISVAIHHDPFAAQLFHGSDKRQPNFIGLSSTQFCQVFKVHCQTALELLPLNGIHKIMCLVLSLGNSPGCHIMIKSHIQPGCPCPLIILFKIRVRIITAQTGADINSIHPGLCHLLKIYIPLPHTNVNPPVLFPLRRRERRHGCTSEQHKSR